MFIPPPMSDNEETNLKTPPTPRSSSVGSRPIDIASEEELFQYAFGCLKEGARPEDVYKQLLTVGHPARLARSAVDRAIESWSVRPGAFSPGGHAKQSFSGNRAAMNLLIGGGVLLLGIIVTMVSLNSQSGGRIAIGAIVWGAIQLIYGLFQMSQE